MQVSGKSLQDPAPWGGAGTLGHALLEPTLIYVKRLLALTDAVHVKVSIDACVPAPSIYTQSSDCTDIQDPVVTCYATFFTHAVFVILPCLCIISKLSLLFCFLAVTSLLCWLWRVSSLAMCICAGDNLAFADRLCAWTAGMCAYHWRWVYREPASGNAQRTSVPSADKLLGVATAVSMASAGGRTQVAC